MEEAIAAGDYDVIGDGTMENPKPRWLPGKHRFYDFNCGMR